MENIVEIISSPNDDRKGIAFLLENKMKVILFQDKKASNNFVSLTVNIGSHQDTILGIAHFLEHMLFRGTENYRGHNDFNDYIQKRSGESNAWTAYDRTCYYYSLAGSEKCFLKSLDMFSEFFYCPLINENCVSKEIKAVNAEHVKNISNDVFKIHDILRVAMNKENWFSKFSTGSSKTLNVENIHLKVRDFFDKYYSSDLMTLIIVTNSNNIKNIKDQIKLSFENIKIKKHIKNTDLINNTKLFKTPSLIKMIPINDIPSIIFHWEINFYSKKNKFDNPIFFLLNLINNKQKNSIKNILIDNNYATDFFCSITDIYNEKCILIIHIDITEYGIKNKSDILFLIKSFFNILKEKTNDGSFISNYNENIEIEKYNFLFYKMDFIENINFLITNYPYDELKDIKYILKHDALQEKYSSTTKNKLLNLIGSLDFENCVIIEANKNHDKKEIFQICEYYKTKYSYNNKKIKIGNISTNVKNIAEKLNITTKNKYVSLLTDYKKVKNNKPICLKIDGKNIYYQYDTRFKNPNISLYLAIKLENIFDNITNYICFHLYLKILKKEYHNLINEINFSGYNLCINIFDDCIYFYLHGNYGNIELIFEKIINSFFSQNNLSQKNFEIEKENFKLIHEQNMYAPSYEKIDFYFYENTNKKYFSDEKILSELKNIDLQKIEKICDKYLKNNNITSYIYGNCDSNMIENMIKIIKIVPSKCSEKNGDNYDNYIEIIGKKNIEIENNNKQENNNCVRFHIPLYKFDYLNYDYETHCIIHLLNNIISPYFYKKLRSEETYGYVVKAYIYFYGKNSSLYLTYCFLVVSERDCKNISERIKKFIKKEIKPLLNIEEKEFENIKKSYIELTKKNHIDQEEYADEIFHCEIMKKYLKFGLKNKLANACEKIKISDLKNLFEKYFACDNYLSLQLSSQK